MPVDPEAFRQRYVSNVYRQRVSPFAAAPDAVGASSLRLRRPDPASTAGDGADADSASLLRAGLGSIAAQSQQLQAAAQGSYAARKAAEHASRIGRIGRSAQGSNTWFNIANTAIGLGGSLAASFAPAPGSAWSERSRPFATRGENASSGWA